MRLVSFVNILTALFSISAWTAEKPPEKIQRLLDRVAEKSGDPFHRMALAHELGRSDRMELQRWVTDDQIAAVLRRVPGMSAISEEIAILSFITPPQSVHRQEVGKLVLNQLLFGRVTDLKALLPDLAPDFDALLKNAALEKDIVNNYFNDTGRVRELLAARLEPRLKTLLARPPGKDLHHSKVAVLTPQSMDSLIKTAVGKGIDP
ncbi:hypothetical protein K2X30_15650 [bacterium]|nr:hypothetical protein [bacterium]